MRLNPNATERRTPIFTRTALALIIAANGLVLSGLSGCSYLAPYKAPVTQGNVMTTESVELLQAGLNQTQVRKLLGPPMGENAFNPYHWEYVFYTTDSDSNVEVRKQLIINFDQARYLTDWKVQEAKVDMQDEDTFFGL
ncbi:hypothetical protein THMIRHAS_16200 [Thiosulfatimonas sediminis]|uniref:Outer membrane protein assembly factor BamE n=1 Tax=Thiosulfatimonas sediminis TaxID=2675054 RepID=A0A6F8PW35_9GAMM|nr:outer membrane protein assembly factor BamE [Thiosulfatimonas sediminis]BBP46247.1 hypothetical protein THMIRHAS_16200 [Thiosulfatimonas sediminis]